MVGPGLKCCMGREVGENCKVQGESGGDFMASFPSVQGAEVGRGRTVVEAYSGTTGKRHRQDASCNDIETDRLFLASLHWSRSDARLMHVRLKNRRH